MTTIRSDICIAGCLRRQSPGTEAVRKQIPNALIERASIEDIFVGYTRRRMA